MDGRRRTPKVLLVLALIGIAAGACGTPYYTVARNHLEEPVLVGRYRTSEPDVDPRDMVDVKAHEEVDLETNASYMSGSLYRVVVMTEACVLLADELLKGFTIGGLIDITYEDVSLTPGNSTVKGEEASVVKTCKSSLPKVEAAP